MVWREVLRSNKGVLARHSQESIRHVQARWNDSDHGFFRSRKNNSLKHSLLPIWQHRHCHAFRPNRSEWTIIRRLILFEFRCIRNARRHSHGNNDSPRSSLIRRWLKNSRISWKTRKKSQRSPQNHATRKVLAHLNRRSINQGNHERWKETHVNRIWTHEWPRCDFPRWTYKWFGLFHGVQRRRRASNIREDIQ